MGTTALKTFGWILILAAMGLAVYAYLLWNRPPAPPPVVEVPVAPSGPQVVVALRAIPNGHSLVADDLTLAPVSVMPDGAYLELSQVLGQQVTRAVGKGQPLTPDDFRRISLARQLEPDERAVAIKTDLVRGVGGYLQPGDRVDILVYIEMDHKEVSNSQSMVLLKDIRLLCYGESCQRFRSVDTVTVVQQEGVHRDSSAHTAVLAIPETGLTRLMLGAGKGLLRLALRTEVDQADTQMADTSTDAAASATKASTPKEDKTDILVLPQLLGQHRPSTTHRSSSVVAEVIRGTQVDRLTR